MIGTRYHIVYPQYYGVENEDNYRFNIISKRTGDVVEKMNILAIGSGSHPLPVEGGLIVPRYDIENDNTKIHLIRGDFTGVYCRGYGDTIDREGKASINLSGENISKIVVDGIWEDWDIINHYTDSKNGEFIRKDGKAIFEYQESVMVEPSMTIQPSQNYHQGDYLFKMKATDNETTVTDTFLVKISD